MVKANIFVYYYCGYNFVNNKMLELDWLSTGPIYGLVDHFTFVCLVAWPLNESEAGVELI